MRKATVLILCILLCTAPLTHKAYAAESRDISFEESIALRLNELGLVYGVGENDDGTINFDLNREPSRIEALVMLVRMLGKGSLAETLPKTHPFSDVPSWADGYISYAYDSGLTRGVSDTLFGAQGMVSAEMYLTFMLRALGYSDGDGIYSMGDFMWDRPWALAAWCGILSPQVFKYDFLRADMVSIACAALFSSLKGTQTALGEQLAAEGVFTSDQFSAVLSDDFFSKNRLMDSRILSGMAERHELGLLNDNIYAAAWPLIMDVAENDDALRVEALVYLVRVPIAKGNIIGDSSSGTSIAVVLELDPATLDIISSRTIDEISAEGGIWNDYFSEISVGLLQILESGNELLYAGRIAAQSQLDLGHISYMHPSYEEALEREMTTYDFLSLEITTRLEAAYCTVLVRHIGGLPSGGAWFILLVCKPGSPLGEGEVFQLPIPTGYGGRPTYPPDEIWLSEDGLLLYYTYYFDEPAYGPLNAEGDRPVFREAGLHVHTVDLATGETTVDIEPV